MGDRTPLIPVILSTSYCPEGAVMVEKDKPLNHQVVALIRIELIVVYDRNNDVLGKVCK